MTTTTPPRTETRDAWSTPNKVGLGLAAFYAVANIPSAALPVPDGDGPPTAILVIDSLLGVVALVATVVAWRTGSRPAARLAAASLVVVTLTSLPAFFVDASAGIQVLVATAVLLTIALVVLIFSPAQRR